MTLQTVLAISALTVLAAGCFSLVLYLPLLATAESVPPQRPVLRAIVWLIGLYAPLVGGLIVAFASLSIAANVYASPHAERVRPHICFAGLVAGPDGPFRGKLIAWLAAGLLLAGIARLLGGAFSSARLGNAAAAVAAASDDGVCSLPSAAFRSYSVGLLRPVAVLEVPENKLITAQQRAVVIAHEMRHCQQRHNLIELFNSAAVTSLIFVPTAHLYRSYWRQETEFDCDAAAAAATSPATVIQALQLFGKEAREGAVSLLEKRLRRLAGEAEDEVLRDRGLMLLFAGLGLLAVGVALIVARRQELDTLHCAATSFLEALGR